MKESKVAVSRFAIEFAHVCFNMSADFGRFTNERGQAAFGDFLLAAALADRCHIRLFGSGQMFQMKQDA